ncbi:MAG: cation transporter [Lachnospiraceae bacterium]|nr:cation transporter [Lachnospiraceae bacterium]
MIRLLVRAFIKDYQQIEEETVRRGYGVLCSVVGIVLNVLLFAGKYLAGAVSGSVAMIADALNNLSDAGSSFVTLIGFRIAGKKADKGHPFGHGRMEYVSGLIVSFLILLMGVEILRDSFEQVLHPTPVETGVLPVVILLISLLVKGYMGCYNRRYGNLLGSSAMKATSVDSFSDMAATAAVLISSLLSAWLDWNIDGWCGMAVALFILYAGVTAAREMLNPLLGQAPDPAFVRQIESMVRAHPQILDVHDLIVHDYGPGRRLISLHGEVSGEEDIYELHEMIDGIERELEEKLGCQAVIHMDPVPVNDKRVCEMKAQLSDAVGVIHPEMTVHDFHHQEESGKERVMFDVVLPDGCGLADEEAMQRLIRLVHVLWGTDCDAVIRIDHR